MTSFLTSTSAHQKKEKLQSTYSRASAISAPVFEHVNTAAGSFAASASEKQDEGTAADTHQVQPAVALHTAWSAIASQAPLLLSGLLSKARAATPAGAQSAIKQHKSKEKMTERAMGSDWGSKRRFLQVEKVCFGGKSKVKKNELCALPESFDLSTLRFQTTAGIHTDCVTVARSAN